MGKEQIAKARAPIQKLGFFWQTAQISQAALTRNPVSSNTESVL